MKINKIIISVAVRLVALFNKVEWEIRKTKPSVRRELRKLQEYYNNQAQEMEAEIIEEKNKKIKELKLQCYCADGERKESKIKKCFDIPKDIAEMLLEDTERKDYG